MPLKGGQGIFIRGAVFLLPLLKMSTDGQLSRSKVRVEGWIDRGDNVRRSSIILGTLVLVRS
jgi:hypothetical protein